jgi:NAD(P)-dependent dehydrogenase (short-subunit alcohol dehydrogenase family)
VNNAGIAGASTCRIHKYDLELWDRVMGVNLRGAFLVLQHALPLMIATGQGAVVNIASLGSPSLLRPYGDESRDIGLYTPSRA